jgi:recombination protein RecA
MSTPDPISEAEVMQSLPEHLRENYKASAEKATDYLEQLRKDRKVKFEHDIQVFGSGARQMPRFSAGSPKLNRILGGGWPKGRIIEIYGPESSGKTTIALHAIAEVQKRGGAVLFVDAEHAFDPIWAEAIGVNVRGLPIEQPMSGEDALALIDHATKSGTFDLIVLDSVAALAPKAELEGEMGDSHVGLQARMMSQAMRKLVAATQRTQTTIMFLNQIRMKVGVMFGNPETTPGGRALKFYSSIRLDCRRSTIERDGDVALGNKVRLQTKKNKTAPPFQKAETYIVYEKAADGSIARGGLDILAEELDLALDEGAIEKAGSWYKAPDEHGELQTIAQGSDAVIEKMKTDHAFYNTIRRRIYPDGHPNHPGPAQGSSGDDE